MDKYEHIWYQIYAYSAVNGLEETCKFTTFADQYYISITKMSIEFTDSLNFPTHLVLSKKKAPSSYLSWLGDEKQVNFLKWPNTGPGGSWRPFLIRSCRPCMS